MKVRTEIIYFVTETECCKNQTGFSLSGNDKFRSKTGHEGP
jgi:hypothetical protein